MHVATISPLPNRHAARNAALFDSDRVMALESDSAGLFDVDAVIDRGQLHRLFEGAVIVSEIDDDFADPGTIGFDGFDD
jgi:hypothetical protein